MLTRKQIEEDMSNKRKGFARPEVSIQEDTQIIISLLLDIRDLLTANVIEQKPDDMPSPYDLSRYGR